MRVRIALSTADHVVMFLNQTIGEVLKIEILEKYNEPRPSVNVNKAINRLLSNVPEEYLQNLDKITITNSIHDSHFKNLADGKYIKGSKKRGAEIELCVNNSYLNNSRFKFRFQIFQDLGFGYFLFYHIGKHIISENISSNHKGSEYAEVLWSGDLIQKHLKKRYWYFIPFLFLKNMPHKL